MVDCCYGEDSGDCERLDLRVVGFDEGLGVKFEDSVVVGTRLTFTVPKLSSTEFFVITRAKKSTTTVGKSDVV